MSPGAVDPPGHLAVRRERARVKSWTHQLICNLELCGIIVLAMRAGAGNVVLTIRKSSDTNLAMNVCGVAFCSPRDEFDLLVGLTIATGRLHKNPIVYETIAGSHLRGALTALHRAGKCPYWSLPTIEARFVRGAP